LGADVDRFLPPKTTQKIMKLAHFSLTEVYFLGFSWRIKEGSPRKHTQSVQRPLWPAGPGSQRLFEKKRSRCSFLKKSNKKALCEKFFTVFVEPMAFACVFLLFENAARKKCFYT